VRYFIEEYGLIIGLVALILVVVVALFAMSFTPEKELQKLYSDWGKLYPQAKLTFEEWNVLRKKESLPGQGKDEFGTGIAVGIATWIAFGMGRR
jgi:hypothetical protein